MRPLPDLIVEYEGRTTVLTATDALTFGRDASCGLCLDSADLGVSRIAGRLSATGSGWAVTNLSRKRPLHIVDAAGFGVPLPVVSANGVPSRRSVDGSPLTVLVVGEAWTYALILRLDPDDPTGSIEDPLDENRTRTQLPSLTDRRREVLVAMTAGYLRPYPYYDPRPRTYQEIADVLKLPKSTVVKRIEQVRLDLVGAGVLGLEKEIDARRTLCEWLLATRVLTPADLEWLTVRTAARDRASPST